MIGKVIWLWSFYFCKNQSHVIMVFQFTLDKKSSGLLLSLSILMENQWQILQNFGKTVRNTRVDNEKKACHMNTNHVMMVVKCSRWIIYDLFIFLVSIQVSSSILCQYSTVILSIDTLNMIEKGNTWVKVSIENIELVIPLNYSSGK